MADSWFPQWRQSVSATGLVAPDETLPPGQTIIMGLQHAVAMFGATVLMPLLMGLDPNLSVMMSGIGTLLFFLITGGRVPSYLGSSAAFVGVVIATTGFNGQGALAGDAAGAAASVVTEHRPLRINQQIFSALDQTAVVVLHTLVGQ